MFQAFKSCSGSPSLSPCVIFHCMCLVPSCAKFAYCPFSELASPFVQGSAYFLHTRCSKFTWALRLECRIVLQ